MSQDVDNSGITESGNNRNRGNITSVSIPDEKRQILEWISPFASRERHQAVHDSLVEKVGDWLLCNQSFSTWHTSADQTAKPVLFCFGHPGAGRTYISSLVIDTLSNGIDRGGVAVAYVYCDFTIRNMQSPSAVLECAKRQADRYGLRLPEILDMLTKFLPSLTRAFICIDALDEFPTKQRAQLWNSLQRIFRECPNTRLFLTGRPQIRAAAGEYHSESAYMVTIEPTSENRRSYIEARLNQGPNNSAVDEELRTDMGRVIPERASGIFRLVCLGMNAILEATTISQKREALDRMANGLGFQDAYTTTLDRIRQQDGSESKLGMAVLMWVSHCERPLRWKELRHILGANLDLVMEGFSIGNVPSVKTVLDCTLGLATIDEYASTVGLLHLTLQKYLRASPTIFETPQSMMAEICLTYLNSPSVREWQPDLDRGLAVPPFLEYAACFWGTRAGKEVTEQVKSQALRLLNGYENPVSAGVFWRERIRKSDTDEGVYRISGLHSIAFWVIEETAIAMREEKKRDVNGRDSISDTPLMWAVRYGNDRVVELLLGRRDIRLDGVIRDGGTVLPFAAKSGNEGAVKPLLGCSDVNPSSFNSNGQHPLSDATARRDTGAVEPLVESRNIDPNSSDSNDLTPLPYVAKRERESLANRFLQHGGVNPGSRGDYGLTPLSRAASRGDEGAVKLLLECEGVDPDSRDDDDRTPLSFAASGGHKSVVKLLLECGRVDPDSGDHNDKTPLLYAAEGGREGVVKLLLERDEVNPDSSDTRGWTPLLFAALRGNEGIVKVLLERGGVNVNSLGRHDQSPLSLAAEGGDEGVVKLLLEREGVNLNSLDRGGRTPLSHAARGGHGGVVKVLLEQKEVNSDSRDYYGQTPLSLAASGGHEGVVKLLLERKEVNPNSQEMNGRTPLSFAASGGYEGIVKALLERDEVNPHLPDRNGRTPLSFATSGGHGGIVKLLQERKEANPDSPEKNGGTTLSPALPLLSLLGNNFLRSNCLY